MQHANEHEHPIELNHLFNVIAAKVMPRLQPTMASTKYTSGNGIWEGEGAFVCLAFGRPAFELPKLAANAKQKRTPNIQMI